MRARGSSVLLRQAGDTARRERLFEGVTRVLAGVSGGADSVAMVYALHYLLRASRMRLSLAHLHHGLRGAAADADAVFVARLGAVLGLQVRIGRCDVAELARREKISLEMAGRRARLAFFAREAGGRGAVALAHTADDQAETLLLRLARGASPAGLCGMRARSEHGGLLRVRPLLDVRRAEVEGFLRAHGLAWREDASNRDDRFLRNRVRHELLPWMEKRLNPATRAALLRAARLLTDDEEALAARARRTLSRCAVPPDPSGLDLARLGRAPAAVRRRVWTAWLHGAGVPAARVDFALVERLDRMAAAPGAARRLALPGGRHAVRSRGVLRLADVPARGAPPRPLRVRLPGVTEAPGLGVVVRAEAAVGFRRVPARGALPAEVYVRRARRGEAPLRLRAWRAGDRLAPVGLAGSRKLQDVFVDAGIPREERHRLPVLVSGAGVVWAPGGRVARAWAVPGPRAAAWRLRVERAD